MIEEHFQKMIAAAFGRQMLTKSQMTELRLAFIGGILIGRNLTIEAVAKSDETLNEVARLTNEIGEAFKQANENR